MGSVSTIEWTDASWNPVTGCTEVSTGCDHCYARTFAERWRGVPGHVYEQGFDLKLWPDRLDLPRRWKKPRRIFVNSMSDLFHKDVPDEFISKVFWTMIDVDHHTYQVLTKRPKRMARFFANQSKPLPAHIWVGTSIENDNYTWRADYLRKVLAMVRFVSAEPLLSALPSLDLTGLHWLIAGGESGQGARPADPGWFKDLRDRCQAAGVAFFFKQWGQYAGQYRDVRGGDLSTLEGEIVYRDFEDATTPHAYRRVGKHAAGRLLDGREWNQLPNASDALIEREA